MVLAALYVHYGRLPWIQGVFYGIGAAVIAIITAQCLQTDSLDIEKRFVAVGAVHGARAHDRMEGI